jgi:hypothetical protein
VLVHIRPSSSGLTTASTHLLAYGFMAGTVPDHRADSEPAKCPESLCPMRGVTPIGETLLPSPQRTLLLLLRSYGLMRQSQQALPYFGFASLEESLQVVFQSLLPAGPSRRYLRESFLGCLIPYSGGPTACLYLFLPLCHRPSPIETWVGFPRTIRLKRLLAGRKFRSGRYFFMFKPPSLHCPPGRPYRCAYCCRAAGAFTSGQSMLRYLRMHRIC